jgi:hypothetical protein
MLKIQGYVERYGIRNKEEVTFIKRLKEKGKHRS